VAAISSNVEPNATAFHSVKFAMETITALTVATKTTAVRIEYTNTNGSFT